MKQRLKRLNIIIKKIFIIGIFSNTLKDKYNKENTIVIKNESDVFFYNLEKQSNLIKILLRKFF